ncbi:hypothetical protein [Shouchella patagoniensis]|uniref:hypothetical protein n=1 Tax=Shouchella patagoniensis TaxID=228576 RepID=UPI000994C148|nr:hypothetical protein [Shouchella patagoniensis]
MIWVIIGALILCVLGLVATLFFISKGDEGYSSEKSMGNLTLLYTILVPISVVVVIAVAFLFM